VSGLPWWGGAVQLTVADPWPAVAVTLVGAPGAVGGADACPLSTIVSITHGVLAPVPAVALGVAPAAACNTVRALVKRAIKSGDIREDLDAIDLLRALVGVANVATSPDWQQSARRLVDILILGSRPVKQR
jgi:hypothetical protein